MEGFPAAIIMARRDEVIANPNVLFRLVKPNSERDGVESAAGLVNVVPQRRKYRMERKSELETFERELLRRPLVLQPVAVSGVGILSCGLWTSSDNWILLINQTHPKILGRLQIGADAAKAAMARGDPFQLRYLFGRVLRRLHHQVVERLDAEVLESPVRPFLYADWDFAELVVRYPGSGLRRRVGYKPVNLDFDFSDLNPGEILIRSASSVLTHMSGTVTPEEVGDLLPAWTVNHVSPLAAEGEAPPEASYSYAQAGRLYQSFRKKKRQRGAANSDSSQEPSSPSSSPPYSHASAPYPQAAAPYPQASPAYPPGPYPQASPSYPQASPSYPQASPSYPQASPTYPQGPYAQGSGSYGRAAGARYGEEPYPRGAAGAGYGHQAPHPGDFEDVALDDVHLSPSGYPPRSPHTPRSPRLEPCSEDEEVEMYERQARSRERLQKTWQRQQQEEEKEEEGYRQRQQDYPPAGPSSHPQPYPRGGPVPQPRRSRGSSSTSQEKPPRGSESRYPPPSSSSNHRKNLYPEVRVVVGEGGRDREEGRGAGRREWSYGDGGERLRDSDRSSHSTAASSGLADSGYADSDLEHQQHQHQQQQPSRLGGGRLNPAFQHEEQEVDDALRRHEQLVKRALQGSAREEDLNKLYPSVPTHPLHQGGGGARPKTSNPRVALHAVHAEEGVAESYI